MCFISGQRGPFMSQIIRSRKPLSGMSSLVRGTVILTGAAILTRFMGFFFRIFLSRAFQEEGMGLYQLVFPVYGVVLSVTAAGIQTALSRMVAAHTALHQDGEARVCLGAALILSGGLSLGATVAVQQNAAWIAGRFLGNPDCAGLLTVLSWAFPPASVHSCICGYYLGKKGTRIPAQSQLLEQTIRILSVWGFYSARDALAFPEPVTAAVLGLVCGELAAAFYSIFSLRRTVAASGRLSRLVPAGIRLIRLSAPLSATRLLLSLLQSVEAASIPLCLQQSALTASEALSVYGTFSGMALPCILFPSALTGSVSTMLVPEVAQIQAARSRRELKPLIIRVCSTCFLFGIFCMLGFFILGNWIGRFLFHSPEAGQFILTLSFICPFLYTNGTLTSILNGLGKTGTTFLISALSLGIRIGGVFFLIPRFSIQGYLWGLLASQLFTSAVTLFAAFRAVQD